jgi:hypothetical protein
VIAQYIDSDDKAELVRVLLLEIVIFFNNTV